MLTPDMREQYESAGYVVVDNLFEPRVLAELHAAVSRVRAKVLSGEVDIYTHRSDKGEPWAIRGLFAPEFGEPIFAEHILDPRLMEFARSVLGPELRLGGTLIFTNPDQNNYGTGWHRDVGKEFLDVDEATEMAMLNRPQRSFKWHLALAPDSCLQLIPGSHRRYRTEREREVLFGKTEAGEGRSNEDLPGQYTIELRPGQTVFWNGNTIHRGVYQAGVSRLTLVGVWERYRPDEEPKEVDPRLEWMLAPNVRGFLPEPMRPLYDRWRAIQVPRAEAAQPAAMMG